MVVSKTELFDEVFQSRASLFKALAHPARLQILQFLAATKTCIKEIFRKNYHLAAQQ